MSDIDSLPKLVVSSCSLSELDKDEFFETLTLMGNDLNRSPCAFHRWWVLIAGVVLCRQGHL